MIEFQSIDDFMTSKTELPIFVSQRYLYREVDDLRSNRTTDLARTFESNLTSTTLPGLLSMVIEQLHQSQYHLIEKRNKLLSSWFLPLRSSKNRQLKIIDEELDNIEYQIIALERNEKEKETNHIEKFINANKNRIKNYKSETNSLG